MNPDDYDLESRDGIRAMLTAVEEENLKKIFGPDRLPLGTDEDLLELAKLVEDESDEENDLVIDHDFDFGTGN